MLSMMSQINAIPLFENANAPAIGLALLATASCIILSLLVWRTQRRFVRRWESVDKRLSEVLWRTRHSDAEELRKRTALLEQQLVEMLQYLRTVANTIDTQLEGLGSEMKSSLGKLDRTESKSVGQSRMVIYQLERIRKQLSLLEESGVLQQVAKTGRTPAAGSSRQESLPLLDKGYRVEAVFEPIRKRIRESERSNAEVEQLLDELTWEKKP